MIALLDSGFVERIFGEAVEEGWDGLALFVSLCGLAVRVLTVGFVPGSTSGRNTTEQRAAVLNTSGAYSVVRNPLYLGNFLILLGFALATMSWWFTLIACLAFALYYERIIHAEEGFLCDRFGDDYRRWAERTPAFLPALRLWRRPSLPFSLRTVLRREYNGFYLVVVVFVTMDLAGDMLAEGESFADWLAGDPAWPALFLAGTALYALVRLLKKYTGLLAVPGR